MQAGGEGVRTGLPPSLHTQHRSGGDNSGEQELQERNKGCYWILSLRKRGGGRVCTWGRDTVYYFKTTYLPSYTSH